MKLWQILFSLNGTITRKQWWIYTLIAFVLLFWVVFPALFAFGMVLTYLDMGKIWIYAGKIIEIFSICATPMLALWCFSVLNIKRLRERGRKWTGVLMLLIFSFMFYMAVLLIPGAITDIRVSQDFYLLTVCIVFFMIGIWPLIELGFLKGTAESDRSTISDK